MVCKKVIQIVLDFIKWIPFFSAEINKAISHYHFKIYRAILDAL